MGRRSRGDSVLTAFPEAEVMPSGAPRLAGPPPPFRGVGWKNGARTAPGVGPTETAVKTPKRTMCRGGPEPPTETRTRPSTRSPGGLRVPTPATASGTEEQLRVAVLSEQGAPGRCSEATGGRRARRAGPALSLAAVGGVPGGQSPGARQNRQLSARRVGVLAPRGLGGPPSPSSLAVTHSLQQVMSGPFRRDAL